MVELLLTIASEDTVETASDALIAEAGALSVSVEDADAGTGAEQALFGEPGTVAPHAGWHRSVLRALFSGEAQATEAATWLLSQEWAGDVHLQSLSTIADQDWVRLTQSQFGPVRITDTFWVVPSWHLAPADATTVIRLDPGLAFGTGTHPTTRMCLRWIARHASSLPEWARVLDYGCGSGILAIAAALMGARAVDAVDIDPAAVESAKTNAQANGVIVTTGPPETAAGAYPLVLANILATPLKLLAPLLSAHVAPAGHLVLAGILERQAGELQDAYRPWCKLEISDEEDGWILMTAQFVA